MYNQDVRAAGKIRRNDASRRILVYASLALGTIAAGLVLRLAPTGLPYGVVKWGGSALWAGMVYLILAGLLPSREPRTIAPVAAIVAALVELVRLYHAPGLDAFRATPAGILLLGRVFSLWHFVVYWAVIALAAIVDQYWIRRWIGLWIGHQQTRNRRPRIR